MRGLIMKEVDSYDQYCKQLVEAVSQYPNLKVIENEGRSHLKGIVDIPDETGEVVGNFLIEVHFKKGFPFRFPKLFETGGIIPDEANWHKYRDGSCCITVPPDEILKCKNGISVSEFIARFAIPYFANYLYRKKEGVYLNGEYEHGLLGISQFYSDLLGTDKHEIWKCFYRCVFGNEKINCERNDICFCKSGKKFKHCHLKIFNSLRLIGETNVLNDFKSMYL
jgi:hypothetical protein